MRVSAQLKELSDKISALRQRETNIEAEIKNRPVIEAEFEANYQKLSKDQKNLEHNQGARQI